MFTTIMLIGTGWSLFKPFLTEKDKRIVAVVIPLQVMTNVAMIYVEEHVRGSQGWLTWRDLLHLMDIACCCAILMLAHGPSARAIAPALRLPVALFRRRALGCGGARIPHPPPADQTAASVLPLPVAERLSEIEEARERAGSVARRHARTEN